MERNRKSTISKKNTPQSKPLNLNLSGFSNNGFHWSIKLITFADWLMFCLLNVARNPIVASYFLKSVRASTESNEVSVTIVFIG